jgi:adenine/guanine/hypoxanthine permease
MIPLTFSIANGIGIGIIAYAVLKLVSGKATMRDWLLMLLAAVFIFRFFWM